MAIQGLRNTTSYDTPGGRRPQNYRETLLMLYPNGGGVEKAPLTALTAVMKSEATDDPVFHWFTKQMQDRRLKLAASLNNTDVAGAIVTITVDATVTSALSLKEGDNLMVEQTKEILHVNATPASTTSISVIRGFQLTAGVALGAVAYNGDGINPFLKVVGSAYEEGSAAPDPIAFDPIELFSQTQIFRNTYGLTNTAANTRTRLGNEEAEQKREAMEIMGVDMEMAFWFGQYRTTLRNGQPLRMTKGIDSYIPSDRRYSPDNGEMSYDWFETISQDIFRYGSSEKMAFCGGAFLTAVSQFVRKNGEGQFHLGEEVTEYGMRGLRRLRTPTGSIVLKAHPLFTQMTGGVNGTGSFTSMDNAAYILDMGNIRYRFLRNRDVKFQDNLQGPGVDAKLAGWIGECGLEVHHPYTHSLITGVRKGVPDPR